MNEDFFEKSNYSAARGGSGRDGSYPRRENAYPRRENRFNDGRTRFNRAAESGNNDGYPQYRNRNNYRPEGSRPRFNPQNQETGYQQRRSFDRDGDNYRSNSRSGNGRTFETGGYRRENNFKPRFSEPHGQGHFSERPSYPENNYGDSRQRPYRPRYNEANEEGQQRYSNGYRQQNGGNYAQRQYRGNYNPHAKYSQKKRFEYKQEHFDPNEPVRLNKFLANAGVCSRRDADKYITAGVVTVNGVVVTELGSKVLRTDTVMFHDTPIKMEKKVYVLLNKPKGYVTTSEDPQNRKIVMDLVKDACRERIYPVGRLDRNTTGVLLLTNDGELASKLTHPKYLKKKIYHVYTDKNVSVEDMRQIAEGITLEDGEIKADAIDYASDTDRKQVGIEIHSGKNRIVRRIFEHFGYKVEKLDRVYFAGLTKKNVKRGDWRYLTEKEVNMLRMGAFE